MAVLALLLAVPGAAKAQNDADLLHQRITGDQGDGTVSHYQLSEMVPPLGEDSEEWAARRRSVAKRMAQRELSDMLRSWAESDSVLGSVERLRTTDFSLTGSAAPEGEADANGLRRSTPSVRLRLSETIRLRVSNGALSRDLYYDVVDQHAWMELFGAELKDGRTGLSLTNEYLGDEDVARVLFTIRHRLE